MLPNTALFWWSLGILNSKRYGLLKDHFGDIEAVVNVLTPELMRQLGLQAKTVQDTLIRMKSFHPDACRAEMAKAGVELISIEDKEYPAMLREIPDAPVFLSYRGNIDVLRQRMIGIVGTRRMTPYGRRATSTFVPSFIRSGIVTVSGLAAGIDAAVARDTIEAGGAHVAVLGNGLGEIYPRAHTQLARDIVANGGLILSEYPLTQRPETYMFPARNRIIAGLSAGTLVIEAPEESGSIITARLALEYNREVFAVPAQIFDAQSAGCHMLIAAGHAHIADSPERVLGEIGVIPSDRQSVQFNPGSDDERIVYGALTGSPQSIDDLSDVTRLSAPQIATALTMIELAGAAANVGNGFWVRR